MYTIWRIFTMTVRDAFVCNKNALSDETLKLVTNIEKIEYDYLKKYYHFLKYVENEMLRGFNTKEEIKNDWISFWGGSEQQSTSDFAVGAERIVYALLNGKGIGSPNSCPVGSDLMFELDDAFIHIDLKTVNTENIGDFNNSIFIGKNQNSYKFEMQTSRGTRNYEPHLPVFYTVRKENIEIKKVCLSYFITILYDKTSLETMCITLTCMPNGNLSCIYGCTPLKAGKNKDKARFNFSKVEFFETLSEKDKCIPRTRVIYMNKKAEEQYPKKLKYLIKLYHSIENTL